MPLLAAAVSLFYALASSQEGAVPARNLLLMLMRDAPCQTAPVPMFIRRRRNIIEDFARDFSLHDGMLHCPLSPRIALQSFTIKRSGFLRAICRRRRHYLRLIFCRRQKCLFLR